MRIFRRKKKIGLALGGGAVLGAAHIGVLKAIEEFNIPISYIAGTSIGAIISAFYAFGKNWEEMAILLKGLNWLDISRISLSQFGLLSNKKLGKLITDNLGDVSFDEACIPLAGLYSALKIVGKKIEEAKVRFFGAGAASVATARILISAGVKPENIIMSDSKGTLHKGRTELKGAFDAKWHLAQITNPEGIEGGPEVLFEGADAVYCYTKPGPGIVKKEWVSRMAKDAILFACANPIPEIWPWEAKEAGARIVATGRSDFPNQVNNSLGFPGIFRGTLDVQARTITDEMCIAAAQTLSKCAEKKGLSEEYLIPTMDEAWVYPEVATAVALKAIEQGIARKVFSREELLKMATEKIQYAQNMTKCLTENNFIKMP
jgi:malate dehydrogenase (oxaloacetate-decarboxylating)